MDKNKYNIEEVFKSELEDFEMDLPQNLWSNLSNNLVSNSVTGKASLFGGKLFSIVAISSSIAIVGGVLIFVKLAKTNSEVLPHKTKEIIKKEIIKTTVNDLTLNNAIEIETKEIKIETIIEEVKKKKNETSKQYIIKNNNKNPEKTSSKDSTTNNSTKTSAEKETILPVLITPTLTTNIKVVEVESAEVPVSISASPIGGYAPLTVLFSHNNEAAYTLWNFKDGDRSEQKEVSHTFKKQGTYDIELTVTNKRGESSISTKIITVLSTSNISHIPNIFTPNNDNINDFFIVKHKNIEKFNLYIYTKKGELIFETSDIDNGWDGKTQIEEEAKVGEYIYIIKARGIDGKTFEERGIVKLAR